MDFYKKIKPAASPKKLMGIGRWITAIVMVIAVLWAPNIGSFPKLWDYLQQTLAWFSPPVVSLFVMGLFFKRTNEQGAMASIAIGLLLTILQIINVVSGSPVVLPNFLYVAGIHFAICCAVLWSVSLMTSPPPANKLESTVWTRAEFAAETAELKDLPWYKNYRYQALALIGILAVILLYYS